MLQPVHSTFWRWLHKNLTVACNQGTMLILTLSRLTWRSMSACTLGTPNAHVSIHKPCKKHLRREGGGKGTYLVRWSLKALRVYGSLGRPCSLRASQLSQLHRYFSPFWAFTLVAPLKSISEATSHMRGAYMCQHPIVDKANRCSMTNLNPSIAKVF